MSVTVTAPAPEPVNNSPNAKPNQPSASFAPTDTYSPPNTQQFLRRCKLLVGPQGGAGNANPEGLDLSQLRISFVVNRNTLQSPNNAIIRVYNVSKTTATMIQKEFTQVNLQVGYGSGNLSTIFNGQVIRMMRGASPTSPENLPSAILGLRESQVDTFLEFVAADGDMPYNFGTMSVSLVANSTAQQQLDAITKALAPYGVTLGYNNLGVSPQQTLPRGVVLHGMIRDVLHDFCEYTNTTWSIQNGVLEIIAKNQGAIPGNAIVVNSQTGLINQPRETVNGVEFTMLMNPYLRAGRAVKITADIQQASAIVGLAGQQLAQDEGYAYPLNPNGFYRIFYYQHIGDTRGNPWYTNCIARSILADGSSAINPGASSTIQYGA